MKLRKLNVHGAAHLLVLLVLVVIVGITGCFLLVKSHADNLKHTGATITSTPWRWMVGAPTLDNLLANDTSGIVKRTFNVPPTYVLVSANSPLPAKWKATTAQSFTSEASLATAVSNGRILPGVKALVYDNENWPYTPLSEQNNPALYEQLAANVAHAHGLQLITVPSLDLVSGKKQPGETNQQAYLRLGIAAGAAKYADAFEIQAQGLETNPQTYANFVHAAAAQARAANPSVVILAGLSTNPSGQIVSAAQLVAAANAVASSVSGFWMNDPANSGYCPNCSGPYPNTVIQALKSLQTRP